MCIYIYISTSEESLEPTAMIHMMVRYFIICRLPIPRKTLDKDQQLDPSSGRHTVSKGFLENGFPFVNQYVDATLCYNTSTNTHYNTTHLT